MALQANTSNFAPCISERREKAQETKKVLQQAENKVVVTFTSGTGEVFEIPDLPENLARATAIASEKNLSKIWASEQETKTCQDMFGER